MKIEVSIGEAIDKLNILEIKMKKIKDEMKQREIEKEIIELNECNQYKREQSFYYNLLTYVNEKIWDLTNVIKNMKIEDSNFAIISNQIFELNQKRFRIKNWFNLITSSNIKEQKSYLITERRIIIENEDIFYNKIAEIHFLALEYDNIIIYSSFNEKIKSIINIPTITYLSYHDFENDTNNYSINIFLKDFNITKEETEIFQLKPIIYISGGLLGDFIHQLSVIYEMYLKTGRKGILYVANNIYETVFRKPLEKTFNDTYDIVISQNYIHSYKIYNNEPFDINLSDWRLNSLLYKTNWYDIFKNTYNVEWGTHQWLRLPKDDKWNNRIVINVSLNRPTVINIDFNQLYSIHGNSMIFVSFDIEDYIHFKKNKNTEIEYYCPSSLYELCIIINSCYYLIGSLSSPLSFGHALNSNRVVALGDDNFSNIHLIGMNRYFTNCVIP